MLDKNYQPELFESEILKKWEESKAFEVDPTSEKPPFSIILPPPNATGHLHLGHAVMVALEDIMARFKRMQGFETLWLPGTDHAGIATQCRVEQNFQEAGMANPRLTLGRAKLVEAIEKFVEESKQVIRSQIKAMGASADWSREAYTLDSNINQAVNQVFKNMFEDGLIYQGSRIVNWDPNMKTTVSDDEIEHKEQEGTLYYIQYGPLIVATSRPETKLGDTAVAVNPHDPRWQQYIGQTITVDFPHGHSIMVPVIADDGIEIDFGSGALGVTPAHSMIDLEIAKKNNIQAPQVIDFNGNMTAVAGPYQGLNLFECRQKFVADLKEAGLLIKEEKYTQSIAVNYRGKGVIEPQIMKQWFIDVNKPVITWNNQKQSLKSIMQAVINDKMIEIVPSRFEKTYFHWIENLQDWCISRQLWWGHQIPIWYQLSDHDYQTILDKGGIQSSYDLQALNIDIKQTICSEKKPDQAGNWLQDPDCLDTWFSSGLWTFTTMGWPKTTDLLKKFHPTSVLETGYDILFFWVARMILLTTYIMRKDGHSEQNSIPFKTIYLHGLVLDRNGSKMSKSKPETCIDPLVMIPKYGADSLRLSLIIGSTPGNNTRLYEEKIAGYRNFVNKIWNIARYIISKIEPETNTKDINLDQLSLSDKWILHTLQITIENTTNCLENYKFSEAGEIVYQFLKDDLADWYLEITKIESQKSAILQHILNTSLKLLHPFIPFVTEAIWEEINDTKSILAIEKWPVVDSKYLNNQAEEQFILIKTAISNIRRERSEFNIASNQNIELNITTSENIFSEQKQIIEYMTKTTLVDHITDPINIATRKATIQLNIKHLVDYQSEKDRVNAELEHINKQLNIILQKLNNDKFMQSAKIEIIEKEQDKKVNFLHRQNVLKERLNSFE